VEPRTLPYLLVVYQHPVEVWRPTGSASLITETFPATRLFIRGEPESESALDDCLSEPGRRPHLVFPEEGAIEAGELSETPWSPGERPVFVLVDGSWRQARRMRRRLLKRHPMPVVTLKPAAESGYRVRRQRSPGNLATAEAAALLIGRLAGRAGPDPGLAELFDRWVRMVLILRGLPPDRDQACARDGPASGCDGGAAPAQP
jgi:DTW domain-containing protein YfiP